MEEEQLKKAMDKLYALSGIFRQLGSLSLTADSTISIGIGYLLSDIHAEIQRAVWHEQFSGTNKGKDV